MDNEKQAPDKYTPEGKLTDAGLSAVYEQLGQMETSYEEAPPTEESAAPDTSSSEPESTPEPSAPNFVVQARLEKARRDAQLEYERKLATERDRFIQTEREKARTNLEGYLEELGFSPEDFGDVATRLYAKQLGDNAPEVLKNKIKESELQRKLQKIDELENKLNSKLAEAEISRKYEAYGAEIRATANNPDFTQVQIALELDPQETMQTLADAAIELERQHGTMLPASDVVRFVEQALTEYHSKRETLLKKKTTGKPRANGSDEVELSNKVAASGPSSKVDVDDLRRQVTAMFLQE